MKKIKEYKEFLLESAPRLPKDINYWLKRRELYSEDEYSYYTIKWLNDKDK